MRITNPRRSNFEMRDVLCSGDFLVSSKGCWGRRKDRNFEGDFLKIPHRVLTPDSTYSPRNQRTPQKFFAKFDFVEGEYEILIDSSLRRVSISTTWVVGVRRPRLKRQIDKGAECIECGEAELVLHTMGNALPLPLLSLLVVTLLAVVVVLWMQWQFHHRSRDRVFFSFF